MDSAPKLCMFNFACKGNVLVVIWICCLLTAFSLLTVQAGGPKKLQFYVHEKRSPPASLILVDPVAGNLENVQFGSVIVIDNDVRETNSTDSTYLGRQLGSVVVGRDNTTFFATYAYVLNTTAYEGSITVSGIVQSTKLVITGGTGNFSYVRGLAVVETLSNTATAALYKYTLRIKY